MNLIKILIIDDDESIREWLMTILQKAGFKVISAGDGLTGVQAAGIERPALIICDILMPQIDGFEVLHRLQQKPETNAIPFIFLTALVNKNELRQGMDLGAVDYLTKPFKPEELLRAVHARLARQKAALAPYHEELMQLEKANRANSNLLNIVEQAVIVTDLEDKIIFWNHFAQKLYGWQTSEVIGKSLNQVVTTGISREQDEALKQRLRSGESWSGEFSVWHKIGTIFPAQVSTTPIFDEQGKLTGFVSLSSDISERKKAEQDTIRLASIVESSQDAIISKTLEGIIVSWNKGAEKLFGYSASEAIGKPITFIAPLDRQEEINSFLQKLKQGRSIEHFETIRITKKGKLVHVLLSISPLIDHSGEIYGASTISQDITERKHIELTLRQSEERFLSLFQASPTATFLSRIEDSCLVDVNEAALDMFGYTRKEMIGHTSRELEIWVTPEDYQIYREKLLAGNGVMRNFELTFHTRNKSLKHALVSARIIDLEGKTYILTSLQDITERKASDEALHLAKEQLRQAQKMEAIGRVAGGVAHDFNNILTGIRAYADLVQSQLDLRDPLVRYIEEIQKEVERATGLTRQLLAVSRSQVMEPVVLNLNELVENIYQLLRRVIGENIEIVTHLHPDLANLKADPTQIEQILLNLGINARDAMPNGGRLMFETSNIELDEGYARQHLEAQPGSYVVLAITDTGIGMSKNTQARIFEPFFTTKQPGKGTGLGLSIIYGIVKQSGGFVNLYSEEGIGTTFKIYLPRVNETTLPGEKAAKALELSLGGSGQTILLVEDDDVLREVTAISLEMNGYKVIKAAGPVEAIRIVKEQGPVQSIQLVLTDIIMSGMNGRELANQLRQFQPGLRIAYMSGYVGESIEFEGELMDKRIFIEKPFTIKQLLMKVRQILQS